MGRLTAVADPTTHVTCGLAVVAGPAVMPTGGTACPYWRMSVPRREFFSFDRRKLGYLNGIEKADCVYCSYVNGLVAYIREVAARTEQYWCPIHDRRRARGRHGRATGFAPYGGGAAYRERLPSLRAELKQ